MQQGEMLYEGKAKQVFLTDDPDMILIHYKDAATAFNNIKKATIENKGVLNNRISTLIFEYLNKQGIKNSLREDPERPRPVVPPCADHSAGGDRP